MLSHTTYRSIATNIYLFIYIFIIYLCIHLFFYSFIHLFICSFFHFFNFFFNYLISISLFIYWLLATADTNDVVPRLAMMTLEQQTLAAKIVTGEAFSERKSTF